MELSMIKVLIAIATVVGLAEVAKRVDPVLSGVLLGLPLGAGLTVYFVSYEQGIDFMVAGLPWAIAGLSSAVIFCSVYLLVGMQLQFSRLTSVAACSVVAMGAFFLSGFLIRAQEWTPVSATVLFLAVAAVNILVLGFVPDTQTGTGKNPTGFGTLLLRGVIAGFIILTVTLAAPMAGSRWTGILSSFPSTLYALLVIVHYESGRTLYPRIIHSFARSVPALAVFYIGCMALLPLLGLNRGFLVVYVISAVYVYLTHFFLQRLNRATVRQSKK